MKTRSASGIYELSHPRKCTISRTRTAKTSSRLFLGLDYLLFLRGVCVDDDLPVTFLARDARSDNRPVGVVVNPPPARMTAKSTQGLHICRDTNFQARACPHRRHTVSALTLHFRH